MRGAQAMKETNLLPRRRFGCFSLFLIGSWENRRAEREMFPRILVLPQVEPCMQRCSKAGTTPFEQVRNAARTSRLSPLDGDDKRTTRLPSTHLAGSV